MKWLSIGVSARSLGGESGLESGYTAIYNRNTGSVAKPKSYDLLTPDISWWLLVCIHSILELPSIVSEARGCTLVASNCRMRSRLVAWRSSCFLWFATVPGDTQQYLRMVLEHFEQVHFTTSPLCGYRE
jgi:hypothetical protein